MYITKATFDIAKSLSVWYNNNMKNCFENKIHHGDILFRYAKGRSILKGNEIHPYHEILYFTDGGGKFYSENFDTDLCKNMLFIIPKNTYHRFLISDQDTYTRLVLNFPESDTVSGVKLLSESRASVIYPPSKDIEFILKKMRSALDGEEASKHKLNLLYGAFLMLISELSSEDSNLPSTSLTEKHELITKCINHIEKNLSKKISIESTAKELNVSSSTLSQVFKNQLGISFYKYITEKRLIYAHSLIANGEAPTKIFLECGYNDYATFYKAYLKMFGSSPSRHVASDIK